MGLTADCVDYTNERRKGKKLSEITQKFSGLNYSNYANFFRKKCLWA